MDANRIAELRALVEAEEMSWGDVAELQAAFEEIDPATLPEPAENASWSDMLDELENRADGIAIGTRDECVKCGLEVEYVGTEPDPAKAFLEIDHGSGWWDRGGNFSCPSGGTHEVTP